MIRPDRHPTTAESRDRPIRWTWRIFLGSFVVLGLLMFVRLAAEGPEPFDVVLMALVAAVGVAAIFHRRAVSNLQADRTAETESFARILQGLSRSVSPDAIVDAIVKDLGSATGADHVVVVRRRPDTPVLEATLVSSRPGVPDSKTIFPIVDLEDPLAEPDRGSSISEPRPVAIPVAAARPGRSARDSAGVAVADAPPAPVVLGEAARRRPRRSPVDDVAAGERIAERIAARSKSAYALQNTLAAPLWGSDEIVGAIVLSRRTGGAWPVRARQLLSVAAEEASMALTRAYSLREAEERASTDALTGLPNRRYFDEFCGLIARRRRADDAVGVLMIDIDRFKRLNDRHGHAAGDQVLRVVASAIAAAVRDEDVPARFGGEEFAVLLRNPSRRVALEVGERVREAVARADLGGLGIEGVSVSVGVAVASAPDQPIPDLVAAADRALYEAKRMGRDRVIAA